MAIKRYKNTGRVLFGFTVKDNVKQAIIIGLISSITIVSTAIGFANAYPTEASRILVAATFSSNTGLIAMLGKPDELLTVGGFTGWRALGAITLIVGIWSIFLSSRLFRGDEEQGRLELILTGKSTLTNATKQLFAAVLVLLLPLFVIVVGATAISNAVNDFGWQLSSIVLFASSVALTALVFASIGAFCAQIAATRSMALKLTATVFGVSFMLRALGDISSDRSWLAVLSPLGWLERLYPLSSPNPIWLLPVLALIVVAFGGALVLANKRDYGASLLPDNDSAKPKYRLLHSGGGLLLRLHRGNALLWIGGLFLANYLFGTFLGTATEALSESGGMQDALNKVTGGNTTNSTELFIGAIFMQMILLMTIMVAGQVNSFRDEESRGYMDNLLVRQSSRLGLSVVKALLIVITIAVASVAISAAMYLGAKSQDVLIDTWAITTAGINIMAVPLLFMGAGLLFIGFVPRLTSVLLYSLIGWAFVVEIVGSVINVNHWILDTSILHHIALAPAVDVRWETFLIYVILTFAFASIGIWRFTRRDIELM